VSFHSDPDMRADLRKPFPPHLISKLPATSKRPALDYVGHAAVTDRLNHAAPDWTYHVDPVEVVFTDGTKHVVAVMGTLTIGGVSRVEAGAVDSPSTYGQELKEAISDFIRRGAMRFGVALDLWAKEDLTSEPTATRTSHLGGGSDNAGTGATQESPPASVPAPSVGTGTPQERAREGAASKPDEAPPVSTSSAGEVGTAPAEATGTEAEVAGEGTEASVPATPEQRTRLLAVYKKPSEAKSKAVQLFDRFEKIGDVLISDLTSSEVESLILAAAS